MRRWSAGLMLGLFALGAAPLARERAEGSQEGPVAAPAPERPAPPSRGGVGPGRRAGAPPGVAPTTAEVEQLFDRYVRNQARIALELTPEQMTAFAPEFNRLQATRRRVQRERQRLLNQLGVASRGEGTVDEELVAERVRALDEHRLAAEQAIRDALAAVDQVLTVPQRARFRVFEQRIERQRLDLLARARRAARGGATAP